jgi:uncharacterized protein (TIGR00251 family)
MILEVKVIPKAKINRIQELGAGKLKVHLCAPADDNKANKALIGMLSRAYKVRKPRVSIIQGERSRNKTVEIREVD